MRKIGIVTAGRSDYGIYDSILKAIKHHPSLRYDLYVTGSHLDVRTGHSIDEIRKDGWNIAGRVPSTSADTPRGIAISMANVMQGFSGIYARKTPDLLLFLGDRFEMHAAAAAAVPFCIPMAHIHGGEITEGSFDNTWRYSLSSMSHLHFVAHKAAQNQLIKCGEERWRITVSGAPALDHIRRFRPLPIQQMEAMIQMPLSQPPLLITFHPETMRYQQTEFHMKVLLKALSSHSDPMVFTGPNADTQNSVVIRRIRNFVAARPNARYLPHLGKSLYFSLMHRAAVMIGNSSSGIIEAASFHLPVINIGDRQKGRLKGGNVIDVGFQAAHIQSALRRALQPHFRKRVRRLQNPYETGVASQTIANTLANVTINEKLLIKKRGSKS